MSGRLTRAAYERLIEEDVARVLAEMQPSLERAHVVEVLRASPDREYALPVLRTCGECRWCHPSEVCMHPKAHAEHEIDGCALPPPSWCPYRGVDR